jgi:predicted nuclease of predicted toxin-antitoxin system
VSGIRIHLDEDCQAHALAKALQQHGIDAKTTNELGLGGVNDEKQVEAAHQAGRVLVTNNICAFVVARA